MAKIQVEREMRCKSEAESIEGSKKGRKRKEKKEQELLICEDYKAEE